MINTRWNGLTKANGRMDALDDEEFEGNIIYLLKASMERRGSGLRKIIEAYQVEKNYKKELKPEFRSTESSFITILKNLNYDKQSVTQNGTQSVGQELKPDDRRKQMVKSIKSDPKITAYDLSKKFDVSERTIKRDLKILTNEEIIEYIGSAKGGYWKVNKGN